MVTKVKAPDIESVKFITEVISSRKDNPQSLPEFYTAIQSDLISSYDEFGKNKGNPEIINALNFRKYTNSDLEVPLRETTLRNLYSTKGDNYITPILNDLRSEHGLLFCPYCGEEVKPSTLDHYLPQEKFPEYAVCLENLVPMCTKCQGKDAKGDKVLDKNNSRIFLHPYYEGIEEFLVLKISPPFDTPNFILNLKPLKDKYEYHQLSRHVVELNIYERFLSFVKSQHINLLKLSKKNRATSNLMDNKIQNYLEEREIKSNNAWGAIYYRSVLSNRDLLNYLNYEDLPDFI